MLRAIKFNIEEYKEKLDKMTESEIKEEWDRVVPSIRKCFCETKVVKSKKSAITSSGVKF